MTAPRPLLIACPACYSPAGEPCTLPTDAGRRPMRRYHLAREDSSIPAREAAFLAAVRVEVGSHDFGRGGCVCPLCKLAREHLS